MYYKPLILLSFIFLAGCDSPEDKTKSELKESAKPVSKDSIKPKTDSIKVSPPLEHEADYKKTLKQQAEEMNTFLLKRDYRSFAKYTHPDLIKTLGGESKMISAMKKGFKEMEVAGNVLTSIRIDEPSKVLSAGDELQTTLTETLEMKVPRGKLITKSVLIAISKDGGKHWYFLDTSGKDLKTIRKELPGISNELFIPAPEQAQLVEQK